MSVMRIANVFSYFFVFSLLISECFSCFFSSLHISQGCVMVFIIPSTIPAFCHGFHWFYFSPADIYAWFLSNLISGQLLPIKPAVKLGLQTWSCYNIGYPSETHRRLKSCEILFVHNLSFSSPIILKFCTEHGSITAVHCANFQNDCTNEVDVIDKQVYTRFEF